VIRRVRECPTNHRFTTYEYCVPHDSLDERVNQLEQRVQELEERLKGEKSHDRLVTDVMPKSDSVLRAADDMRREISERYLNGGR